MKVKCYNKKCLYEWDYRGENKKFICCPICRFKRISVKCRSFFLKHHSENIMENDRPNDRPKKEVYKKIIKKPQTEFIKSKRELDFENIKNDDGSSYIVEKKISKQFKDSLKDKSK